MERALLHKRQLAGSRMGGFCRRSRRERVFGFSCDIADRHRLIGGVVEDVSANGFKMKCVGKAFKGEEHCCQAVLSGSGRHFKILAKPCWRKISSDGMVIGFKILDVSWEWTEMVLQASSPDFQRKAMTANA